MRIKDTNILYGLLAAFVGVIVAHGPIHSDLISYQRLLNEFRWEASYLLDISFGSFDASEPFFLFVIGISSAIGLNAEILAGTIVFLYVYIISMCFEYLYRNSAWFKPNLNHISVIISISTAIILSTNFTVVGHLLKQVLGTLFFMVSLLPNKTWVWRVGMLIFAIASHNMFLIYIPLLGLGFLYPVVKKLLVARIFLLALVIGSTFYLSEQFKKTSGISLESDGSYPVIYLVFDIIMLPIVFLHFRNSWYLLAVMFVTAYMAYFSDVPILELRFGLVLHFFRTLAVAICLVWFVKISVPLRFKLSKSAALMVFSTVSVPLLFSVIWQTSHI